MGRVADKVLVGNLQGRGVQGIAVNLAGAPRGREFTKSSIKLVRAMGVQKTILNNKDGNMVGKWFKLRPLDKRFHPYGTRQTLPIRGMTKVTLWAKAGVMRVEGICEEVEVRQVKQTKKVDGVLGEDIQNEVVASGVLQATSLNLLQSLEAYCFEMKWKLGHFNPYDYSSPEDDGAVEADNDNEIFANYILENQLPTAITWKLLRRETLKDPVMQSLVKDIRARECGTALHRYNNVFHDLTIVD